MFNWPEIFAMLVAVLTVAVVVLGISTAALGWYVLRVRSVKHQDGAFRKWPIRRVEARDFDPRFRTGALGPGLDTEVAFIGAYRVPGGTSDFETWILANLAKGARTIFEFGTATGKTTYLLARNAPKDARVITLTLAPDQLGDYRRGADDDPAAERAAVAESKFHSFYYSATAAEPKITQLFGDSKRFDVTPYSRACDLIFIDGSHAYSYVLSDTEKALRMIAPGGIILWHDYHGPRRAKGVFRALNELSRDLDLVRIKGTALVAYRQPD
jgi:predicted O-methyltransferase YrrM